MPYPVIPDIPQAVEIVADPTTATQKEKVNSDGTTNVRLSDPTTSTNQPGVNAAHLTYNQAVSGFALAVAGFGALTNALGNSDPQVEASFDNQPQAGMPTDAPYYVSVVPNITISGSVTGSASAQNVTLSAVSGTLTRGAPWKIQAKSVISVGGANPELVFVNSVSGSQVNGIFVKNHSNADAVTVVTLNAAKDASVPNPTGAGTSYSATQLFNKVSNAWEDELSIAGENSGATGTGGALAAEVEWVSGGPPLANGTPSQLQYDREIAALGKVVVNSGSGYAITSTNIGDTLLTPTTAANFKTLLSGMWIRLSGGANAEYVRVADTYTVSTAPSTIPLTSPVVNASQTTAYWEVFGANGPGTGLVMWSGEGFEGVLLNDSANPGFARPWQGDTSGNALVKLASPYPNGATAITAASGNVAAATATATLAAAASKTTYITGFEVTGTGATGALAVSVTVTNVITGTLTYTYAAVAGVAVANTPLNVQFPYPIPANATNTTIVVSCPTLGSGNTNNTVVAHGFQL